MVNIGKETYRNRGKHLNCCWLFSQLIDIYSTNCQKTVKNAHQFFQSSDWCGQNASSLPFWTIFISAALIVGVSSVIGLLQHVCGSSCFPTMSSLNDSLSQPFSAVILCKPYIYVLTGRSQLCVLASGCSRLTAGFCTPLAQDCGHRSCSVLF